MKNFILDNSLKNLGKVVLWQYDRAIRLLSLMKHMQVLFHVSVERFWQYWLNKVLAIETCGEFGCTLWSQLLGVSRPTIVDDAGNTRFISAPVFRRLLKGQFFLMKSTPSVESISSYLEIVFGVPGDKAISNWVEEVSEYGWRTNVDELNSYERSIRQYHVFRSYEKGDVFVYSPTPDSEWSRWFVVEDIRDRENLSWKSIESKVKPILKYSVHVAYEKDSILDDSKSSEFPLFLWKVSYEITDDENSSFESIEQKLEKIPCAADYSSGEEMIVMKLYDPNGFCRKMAGASRDSLSINLTYVFGTTEINARISRRRKSGVRVVDDGEMAISYAKTEYFDDMLPDQKALFEQWKDTVCPYPIGIRTNEPVEEQVFGFERQQNKRYGSGIAYAKGDKFGYVNPDDGSFFNWECKEDVSAAENSSFDAIKGKLKKTNHGDPFVGNLVDVVEPYPYQVEWKDDVAYQYSNQDYYITPTKWPAVAKIMPEDRFIEHDQVGRVKPTDDMPFVMLDSGCAILAYNGLYLGRYDNTVYLYKIPMPISLQKSHDLQTEVTDGETYVGLFTDVGLQIITPKMPSAYSMYFQGYFVYPSSPSDEFGVIDAVGKIAHLQRWTPIAAATALNPIDGCRYPSNAGFLLENGMFDIDMKKVEPTTFICNSTVHNLK